LTERNLKQVSINKTIQRIKKITKYAMGHEWLDKDPFILHKSKAVHTDVIFLSPEELEMVETFEFDSDRLNRVKDCFIFCCYTGLAYREMADLRANHIIKEYENKDWIKMKRKKTGKLLMIPILPKAESILKKYNNKNYYFKDGALLPIISNQRFNTNLKEIAKIIGINKKLSHHVARKTFASTVLLFNDVPMEIVSELLGHSDIKTTQKHYGKIVKKTVSKQVDQLTERMKLKE
ncbi:site-specific integrase, partial [bacterium]|nr:site-specific integrase [bacterium]